MLKRNWRGIRMPMENKINKITSQRSSTRKTNTSSTSTRSRSKAHKPRVRRLQSSSKQRRASPRPHPQRGLSVAWARCSATCSEVGGGATQTGPRPPRMALRPPGLRRSRRLRRGPRGRPPLRRKLWRRFSERPGDEAPAKGIKKNEPSECMNA